MFVFDRMSKFSNMAKTISFVTGNKNKLEEVMSILKGNESIKVCSISIDRKYIYWLPVKGRAL